MSAAETKLISIIMPSFRDERILDALASVRAFDDLGTVRVIVVDGGSEPELVDRIRSELMPGDVLVSERDRGIFDGLNKGLDRVETPYLGWIGSDDLFASAAKSSKVVAALKQHDLFVMDLLVVRDYRVRRRTHSWPSSAGLARWGLHNPHYATFGRREVLCRHRFRLDLMGSDIEYFLRVFADRPRVLHSSEVGFLMAEGGYSSASYGTMFRVNRQLFEVYRAHSNTIVAGFALLIKTGYKAASMMLYKLFPFDAVPYLPAVRHRPPAIAKAKG